MDVAALVAWLLTAGGGFVLFGTWVARGGPQQARTGETKLPPALIGGHLVLAAIGLVLWIAYVASDEDALAWVAFVLLLPVALLGFAMLFRWVAERRSVGPASRAAEQRFPVPVVALHGVLAVTTVVLVLLSAVGVGD
jgi:manganese efflux pump family protein